MTGLFSLFRRSLMEHPRSTPLLLARVALALALVCCLLFISWPERGVGAAGLQFFGAVIWINAIFITLGGFTYFPSAISEEKEDGTLQLLRMTRISALSLLIGKGGSRMLEGLLLLAVQVPFTMIGIAMGGISIAQVFAAYVALGAYTVVVCFMGLLAGVVTASPAKACIASVVGLWLLLYGGGIALDLTAGQWGNAWAALDIFGRLNSVTSTGFDGGAWSPQVGGSLCVAGICFAAAWLLFDRCSDAHLHSTPGFLGRWAQFTRPSSDMRAPVHENILWKDFHFIHGGFRGEKAKLILYGIIFIWVGLVRFQKGGYDSEMWLEWGGIILGLALVAMGVEWVIASARTFRTELRGGTLGTLFVVPEYTATTLYDSKARHAESAMGAAKIFLASAAAPLVLGAVFTGRYAPHFSAFGYAFIAAVFALPFAWVHGVFLQRLAIYLSLRIRNGAAPLTFVIWFFANMLALMTVGPLFREAAVVVFPLGGAVFVGVLASKLKEKSIALLEKQAVES